MGDSLSRKYQWEYDEKSPKKSHDGKLIEALLVKVDQVEDNLIARTKENLRKKVS